MTAEKSFFCIPFDFSNGGGTKGVVAESSQFTIYVTAPATRSDGRRQILFPSYFDFQAELAFDLQKVRNGHSSRLSCHTKVFNIKKQKLTHSMWSDQQQKNSCLIELCHRYSIFNNLYSNATRMFDHSQLFNNVQ